MAGTQVLPSWLTLVTTTITQSDGSVQTSATTVQLPLTYYGPSIPLGTDGSWTWGGLTPPASTTTTPPTTAPSSLTPSTSATPTSSPSSASSSSSSSSPISSSLASLTSLSATPASSASSSPPSSSPAAVSGGSSHGLSNAALGAILGTILGSFFLFVLFLLFCFLRRRSRRAASSSQGSSSFWNRQTTLFSRAGSKRQTPIWTGWEVIDPDPDEEQPMGSPRSPGEGSPRGSGEEHDPFLTRRTAGSASTTEEEMARRAKSASDTLINFPPTVALVGARSTGDDRDEPPLTGHILSPEQLMRMDEEGAMPQVRVTEPTPHSTPLAPPPSLGRSTRAVDSSTEKPPEYLVPASAVPARARSPVSEKSMNSLLDQESAQLLTARRVAINEMGQRPGGSTHSQSDSAAAAGPSSALDRLASLGSLGWFKRFSGDFSRNSNTPPSSWSGPADPYTRTPPRTGSRPNSTSRPVSWAPLPTTDPENDSSTGRRRRRETVSDRPVSTLSSRSGTTTYYDARSRPVTPGTSQPDLTSRRGSLAVVPPVPAISPEQRQPSPLAQIAARQGASAETRESDPPAYDSLDVGPTLDRGNRGVHAFAPVDVLDLPVPRPLPTFADVAYGLPPGLESIPKPSVWRISHPNSAESGTSSGAHIDPLEDLPPAAQDSWRSMASGDTRRATFGIPMVAHGPPQGALQSEHGSLHSMRSHLSPHSRLNTSGSSPASFVHTSSGSSSSRPTHSQGRSGSSGVSLAHSNSVHEEERRMRRAPVGEVAAPVSPPVSAVFPGRDWSQDSEITPVLTEPPLVHASSRTPFLLSSPPANGTLTSSRTMETGHSSVTTNLTDPITGARILHAPPLPWRTGPRVREWGDIETAHQGESGW